MGFLTEPVPPYGQPLAVRPGIRRVVAPNAGQMTYHGTNTWLIDTGEGLTVLDPGPDDDQHVRAILAAAPQGIARILVSHGHRDHVGAVAVLAAATGAPVAGFARPVAGSSLAPGQGSPIAAPEIALDEGGRIAGLIALHTPGHAADHLCFALTLPGDEKVLFSGDHVMSWSSSVVNPPGGSMAAYMDSLRRLLGRGETLYLPGHGPPLPDPQSLVRGLLAQRSRREQAIAAQLGPRPQTPAQLMGRVYADLEPGLRRAAERVVLAHLIKLADEGRAVAEGDAWCASGPA